MHSHTHRHPPHPRVPLTCSISVPPLPMQHSLQPPGILLHDLPVLKPELSSCAALDLAVGLSPGSGVVHTASDGWILVALQGGHPAAEGPSPSEDP